MPDASFVDAVESLFRAGGDFHSKSARPDDCRARDSHFDNELFDELSENGRPCSVAGISAPSHSTWALRYARAVAQAVEKAIGRTTVRWSDRGFVAKKRETIAGSETKVRDSLAAIPVLPEEELAKIRAGIESEFSRVHAARFRRRQSETTSQDGLTPLREIRLAVDAMLQRAVDVRRMVSSEGALHNRSVEPSEAVQSSSRPPADSVFHLFIDMQTTDEQHIHPKYGEHWPKIISRASQLWPGNELKMLPNRIIGWLIEKHGYDRQSVYLVPVAELARLLWLGNAPEPITRAQEEQVEAQVDTGILAFGNRQYGIGKSQPVSVSVSEDVVLRAFLGQASMDHATLIRDAALEDAPRVLRNLRKKYKGILAAAIRVPGKKGQGGYFVSIQKALPESHPNPA